MKKDGNLSILTRGILKENPVLILILGTCPTLATTGTVDGAFGMGIAALLVLLCSNVFISLLRNVIPETMRIPCYIVIIAGFVTIVKMFVQAYLPDLYATLGVYLDLITVNCIILGRAEMFAGKIIDCLTVSHSESDGYGAKWGTEEYYGQFDGKTKDDYKTVDTVSGATISNNGYMKAIERCFEAVSILEGGAK